jgi:hypothetical protein
VVTAVALLLTIAGFVVSFHGLWLPTPARAAAALVAFLAVPLIVNLRGPAIEAAMRAALFPGDPGLTQVDDSTRLVLQTADLGSGEATYLTSRGVSSWRWGEASAGTISLVRAARAAATFPGLFPSLHLSGLEFTGGRQAAPKRTALVDGGVYDNMGSEWLMNRRRTPSSTYLILANASGNIGIRRSGFGWPYIGGLMVLKREIDIQYDATTAPRRRWLHRLFIAGIEHGTIVRIDGSIHRWVRSFAGGDDDRAHRAKAILTMLTQRGDRSYWLKLANANAKVATSLSKLAMEDAERLVLCGYLATAAQLHILENWPAPDLFDLKAMHERLNLARGT